MKTNYFLPVLMLIVLFISFTIGCKRDNVLGNVIDPISPPNTPGAVVNDLTQVTASVSGIVLDESNVPIASAVVTSGAATTTTNNNGMFIFQNISLSKENGSVTVVKAGYLKGVRSFKTTAGKNHTVRLQLMQKILSGTVNSAAGGTINAGGGATIIFPAAAFVTSTGAAYTGTVNVYSRWINPTATNLPFIIPGDLRGTGTNGAENILETYGMVGAELEDASGNALKIATGKKATIIFPLPASLQTSAPATIQLWHFDDATARWKENGTATKTGNTYSAQVDKFSFWNVDVANNNFINLDYTLINATTNSPLVSTSTRIKRVSNGSYGYGITNNTGFVSGMVPKNEALVLEVTATSGCNTVVYTQNIGPFAVNTSLGNINITIPTSQYVNFTGTLLNCSAAPVTNGYVSLSGAGGYGGFGNTSATGTFSFSMLNCTVTSIASYNYQGTDNATGQQSNLLSGVNAMGSVNLGTITACGATTVADIYVAGLDGFTAKVWKNGIVSNLSNNGGTSVASSVFVSGSDVYVAGSENQVATVWKNGIATYLTSAIANNSAEAGSVYVAGNDVYVTGTVLSNLYRATLWKNGILTNLTNGPTAAFASAVFVVGSDVYVVGYENLLITPNNNTTNIPVAKLWKNGVPTSLTNGANRIGEAHSVFVSGTDVYVAGVSRDTTLVTNHDQATFWKNGIPTYLTNANNYGNAKSIFVSGNDVYIAGYEQNGIGPSAKATFWKNGIPTYLTNGSNYSSANSIFIFGNDVYVAGNDGVGTGTYGTAKIWKNGVLTNFFNSTNDVRPLSIFVK